MDGQRGPAKPLPVPDPQSEGFWSSAARHVLALQRCDSCGRIAHPPVTICPSCLSGEARFGFVPVGGRGRLMAWTVMRDAFLPAFRDDIPWVVGEAELDGAQGARLVARVDVAAETALARGVPIETVFEDVAPGVALPVFRIPGS